MIKLEQNKIYPPNYFLWFGDEPGREKITIGDGESGFHFTILFNSKERVINVHKTFELANGKKEYVQLFEIKFFTFLRFMARFILVNNYLLRQYWLANRINLGKLKKYGLIVIPTTENDADADKFVSLKRRKKLKMKKAIEVKDITDLFIEPNEIIDLSAKSFWLYSTKRGSLKMQGIAFKLPGDNRKRSFFFISKKNFATFRKQTAISIFNILKDLDFQNKQQIIGYLYQQLSERYPALRYA
jgi:hypothetical protein